MKISFSIHYKTNPGQQIFISGSSSLLGKWDDQKAVPMNYQQDSLWEVSFEIDTENERLEYKYFLKDEHDHLVWEWGNNHFVDLVKSSSKEICIQDVWKKYSAEEKAFYTSAFADVIMKPRENKAPVKHILANTILQYNIEMPRIGPNYKVCILGNQGLLGNWSVNHAFVLEYGDDFPVWTGQLDADKLDFPIEYKYGIWDLTKQEVVTIEEGSNREIKDPITTNSLMIKTDESFRFPMGLWKGAGVAVPVFSLRSESSFGVGEFNDLLDFIDWAKSVGLKMVQVLPVNETIASHNWLDSYPYKAISVMALHPIYMNLEKLGRINDEQVMAEFAGQQKALNDLPHVDYPEVLDLKSRYYKFMYDQEGELLFQTDDYKQFFESNKEWLVPYAAFVYLRDKMKSPNFRDWSAFSQYDREEIEKLSAPDSEAWDDIAVHYYIQYHLDKQLKEVAHYARENGIILKGDIPIGISPNSVEAWTEPHLFNLDAQAGAPPDDFAVKGQNWGFPTYNWEAMAQDGYAWWIKRMGKMADYFNTYRIDHILGFFRIWEVPVDAVEALLGHFNPALPFTATEIGQYGIAFDYDRMVQPYIRHHLLHPLFGEATDRITHQFLDDHGDGTYSMKEEYNTQQKINQHFLKDIEEEELDDQNRKIRNGLFDLVANVVFVSTGYDQWHPRISMQSTSSYNELDDYTKEKLNELYIHYFYRRHEDFWYQKGMEKLPAIVSVANMLVCGEDLGMIPDCVPKSMSELGILSLEIQRMPKNPKVQFAHPADAPYLSVCTTSTHDMSTIRGWWEEDREKAQRFFNQELGNAGQAPYFAEPWVCQQIITQHMYSPAMWGTFPIQDLLAMDGQLRWDETQQEQINYPSDVRHKWRFRMPQSIEELKNAKAFNELLKNLISESGRNSDY